MTFEQCIDAIMRGETSEQYKKRHARIRRLANERDDLMDAIEVLEESGSERDLQRASEKRARLDHVLDMIDELL